MVRGAGAVVLGGVGYLYIAQRQMLLHALGLGLKYPIMLVSFVSRQLWTMLLKPILRKVLHLRGASGGVAGAAASAAAAGGELPGGSY